MSAGAPADGDPTGSSLAESLRLLRTSTARLLGDTIAVSDDDWRAPSRLPYWSRGHVGTHVARQADALIRTGVTTLTGDVLVPRMAGSIGETNRFAQTMLMLVPLGIFRAIDERSALLRVVAGLLTVLITLAVVLSFSRGAAVGLAFVLPRF